MRAAAGDALRAEPAGAAAQCERRSHALAHGQVGHAFADLPHTAIYRVESGVQTARGSVGKSTLTCQTEVSLLLLGSDNPLQRFTRQQAPLKCKSHLKCLMARCANYTPARPAELAHVTAGVPAQCAQQTRAPWSCQLPGPLPSPGMGAGRCRRLLPARLSPALHRAPAAVALAPGERSPAMPSGAIACLRP